MKTAFFERPLRSVLWATGGGIVQWHFQCRPLPGKWYRRTRFGCGVFDAAGNVLLNSTPLSKVMDPASPQGSRRSTLLRLSATTARI